MDERFAKIARGRGRRAARRWYWRQALSALGWALIPDGGPLGRRSWAGVAGDVRLGLRTIRRSPLYALGVSGTLALGLAAATLVGVVAWKVWLAPMPWPDPERVVRLYELEPAGPAGPDQAGAGGATGPAERRQFFSPTLLEAFRRHDFATIEAVSAASDGQFGVPREQRAKGVGSLTLSPGGADVLGIVPTLGRLPVESETEMLLGEELWRVAYGADPDVVGTTVRRGSLGLRVVGVARLPAGLPGNPQVVTVLDWGDTEDRGFRYVPVIARVRRGHSLAEVRAEASAFVAALGEIHPEHRGWSVDAVVLADDLVGPFHGVLALMLAVGTTFLLLAAVNVAGLVAARSVERRPDRSVRLALGASEGRLLRSSLVEGLLLAAVGSATGVLVACWLVGPLRGRIPQDLPRLADVAVTVDLALGASALGVAIGALIGLAGYLAARGVRPAGGWVALRRAVSRSGRRALVVGQVALTSLLVAAGAAMLDRVATLRTIELGYEPEGVSFTSTAVDDEAERWQFATEVLDGMAARGIQAAMAFNTPMTGEDLPQLGMRPASASEPIVFDLHLVSPGYLDVMGIELLAGRDFRRDDVASSQRVLIVSDRFVERYFGAGTAPASAVGRELAPLIYETARPVVVGVVESTRHRSPEAPVEPEVYSPLAQLAVEPMTLLVRGEPEVVGKAVAAALTEVDPDQRWSPLTPYASHLQTWFAPLRLQLLTIGLVGGLGLLLASLGLYAAMAYQVASRRHELGVRKAVGATDGRLLRGVLGRGVAMAAAGALIGLVVWYRLADLAGRLVEGIGSAGAVVPVSVTVVVGVSCLVATLLPALRATRVDPVVTLKVE
jgi:predicted permease